MSMKRSKKNILFLIFLVVMYLTTFFSCTPQKRLNRLIKRHPELKQTEFITYRDTIRIEALKTDTVFSINFDTVTIENERLLVQLLKKDSLIYVRTTAKADTIFIEKQIPVEKIKQITPERTFIQKIREWGFVGLIIFALLYIVALWSNKRNNL